MTNQEPQNNLPLTSEEEFVYEVPSVSEPEIAPHIERDPVGVVASYCTRKAGTDCERCLSVCAHQALSIGPNNTPHLDEETCTRCGLCQGVCDAFCTTRITYEDLLKHVRTLGAHNTPVYFTCAEHVSVGETPAYNVVVLPCIGALPPEFWAICLREGIHLILHIDFEFCETCFDAGPQAATLFSSGLELAQQWSGKEIQTESSYPLEGTIWDTLLESDGTDRRGTLASMTSSGIDIATGDYRRRNSQSAVREYEEKRERMRARGYLNTDSALMFSAAAGEGVCKLERPRLKALVESVEAHPEGATRITRWFAITNPQACTSCKACIKQCPTGARYQDEEHLFTLTDPKKCIACGACMIACEQDAIDYIEGSAAWFLTE